MKIQIDANSLTMGDLEDLETALGEPVGRMLAKLEKDQATFADFTMKELNALVWVLGRREDPALTLEQVRQVRLVDMDMQRPPGVPGAGASPPGSQRSRSTTATRRRNSGS